MPKDKNIKPQPWESKGSKTELENRIFKIKTEKFVSPKTGKEHDFFRLEAGGWINIIPVTEDGRVILVRQFRHGTKEMTLEIPGGMIDPGETPEQAAARELAEETGYHSDSLKLIGQVRPNPAIQDNWCYTFLARPVRLIDGHDPLKQPEHRPDETEHIELIIADLSEIPEIIASKQIDHALVLAAFYHYFVTFMNEKQAGEN